MCQVAMETQTLTDALIAVLDQATFDLESTGIEGSGKPKKKTFNDLSPAEFRDAYLRESPCLVKLHVSVNVPEAAIAPLIETLRRTLGEFIELDTDKIGHAFPADSSDYSRGTFHQNGLYDREYASPLGEFASTLVRVAAVKSAREIATLLVDWKQNQSMKFNMCTVLSGLPISASLTLQQGIQIDPLALSTEDLPRLPVFRRDRPLENYLGLSLLSTVNTTFHVSSIVPP